MSSEGLGSTRANLSMLVLRLAIGLMMAFGHGLGKVPPSEGFIQGVGNMGFPMPVIFAWAAGLSELVGALLIAVGLFTRPAALFLLTTMAVAVFVVHGADPFAKKEMALLYGSGALTIFLMGAGSFSLDKMLKR